MSWSSTVRLGWISGPLTSFPSPPSPYLCPALPRLLDHRGPHYACFSHEFWGSHSDVWAFKASALPARHFLSSAFQLLIEVIHSFILVCDTVHQPPPALGLCWGAHSLTRTGICLGSIKTHLSPVLLPFLSANMWLSTHCIIKLSHCVKTASAIWKGNILHSTAS